MLVYGLCYAQKHTKTPELSTEGAIKRLQKDIPHLMQEASVPGMSLPLVRYGKVVWSGVFGVMSNDIRKPVTKRSIFEAYSLSKPVFSYAVLTLVDQGKIELDKPNYRYMDSGFSYARNSVRKVLDASVGVIVSLLAKDFIKLVLGSITVASPRAWYLMHKWLQDFAYKITISWWVLALSGVLAMLIAFIILSLQGLTAALANPVKSLRRE